MPKMNSNANSFPMEGNDKWKDKALKPGAREPSSTQTGDNKMTRFTKKHPKFGTLGGREQQS